jgi:nucleoside-diphosphate-sugar epimerase
VAKLAAERYCVSFSRVYPLETVALRYFNVFGPRQDPRSEYAAVVPRFIAEIAAGRPAPIYGDGKQRRDFTYVANVVAANLLAADTPDVSGAVLNVATGRSFTVNALADAIGELAAAARHGLVRRLAIERLDGEPVIGSGLEETLIAAGFSRQPRRLVASA